MLLSVARLAPLGFPASSEQAATTQTAPKSISNQWRLG
jgi:hypothetical protein